jgi:hypothetical protein
MSADQQSFNNELRGALFRNDKGDNPARPDYRGRCTINGTEYRISAWLRKAQATGVTFMSLAFTANVSQPDAQAQPTAQPQAQPVAADDVPF